MRKDLKSLAVCALLAVFCLAGCAKKEKPLPKETPDQVVTKFYSLLKKGGRLTLEAARDLTNAEKSGVTPDNFRRYTEEYSGDTEIRILSTRILDQRTDQGERVAEVKVGFKIPSTFGGFMDSTSVTHLILDKDSNVWKIDFLAATIKEEDFKRMAGKK